MAEEPFKKWPSEDSVERSFSFLDGAIVLVSLYGIYLWSCIVCLQCFVHILKGLLSLLEEAEHDRAGELSVVLVIVHL